MTILRRLLKQRVVLPLIEHAVNLAGNCSAIAVLDGEEVLASAGPGGDSLCAGYPGVFSYPLKIEDTVAGHLVFCPLPDAESGGSGTQFDCKLAEFAALSLQAIIDQSYAARAVTGEALEQYRNTALLHKGTLHLNMSLRLTDVGRALLNECSSRTRAAEMGMVLIPDNAMKKFRPLEAFGSAGDIALENASESLLFREIVEKRKGEIVNDLSADHRWRDEVPEIKAMLCLPLCSPAHYSGVLLLATDKPGHLFKASDLRHISTLGSVAATAMANARHFEDVQRFLDGLMQALTTAIDSRDPGTAGHSRRVACYARTLAEIVNRDQKHFRKISFSEVELRQLFYAGMLHDVGKIGVREEVLTKAARLPAGQMELIGQRFALWGLLTDRPWEPCFAKLKALNLSSSLSDDDIEFLRKTASKCLDIGLVKFQIINDRELMQLSVRNGNLTPEEWDDLKRHPDESYRILRYIPFPKEWDRLLTIIREHHEKLDGSGYPDRKKDRDILIESQILAVADIYDALTAKDRPYRLAMPQEKALSVLQEEAGTGKLCQALVELFCLHIEEIEQSKMEN
jgi:HD-GYP domain-containing protein (c-di-GMP phosphodiesterase class II)